MQLFQGGRFLPSCLLVLCSTAMPLQASDAGDDADMDSAPPLETVQVTATRSEQSIHDVSEAVSVVSAEKIDRQAPELLAEMLRGVPGAFFQQTTPGQGIPIIRGLKGSQILHLVDGMRLNNAFFRNAPNQYLGLVDAYATERLEVLRGSAPSLYGADAMGGVLQVLTAEPVLSGNEWRSEGRIYGSFDSADSGVVARLQAAAGMDGVAISGGITYQDHSDRETGGGIKVTPSAYRVEAADFKWRQEFGANSELMVSAQYLQQPSTPRVDELIAGYGQEHPSSDQYEFKPNQRDFLHARYRLESNARWFSSFEAHLARQVITDDRLTQDYGEPEYRREWNESTLDGLTLQFRSSWGAEASSSRELVWGLEYYADEVSSSRVLFTDDGDDATPERGRFPDHSTMDSGALYASNVWQWDALMISAGLRYSWFSIKWPATAEMEAGRLEPDDLTGDIHFNYELRPGLKLVSNIGRGFRPPNIFDLGTLGSRPGNRFNIPNPDLKPESVWSYDLGLKSLSSRWEAEFFLFYSDYKDKISSRFTGGITPEGRFIVRSENSNQLQLWGFESGLRYLLSDALETYAVLNYTRGEEDEDGGVTFPADRIPPLNGRIGLIFTSGRFRLEPWIDFASKQDRLSPRDEEDPRINPAGTAGWATLNLLLSWQAASNMELGLRLENLSDENYREHGSGIDTPGRNFGFWFNARY
jgi:outer membrane receptor protein involved in Fe transport